MSIFVKMKFKVMMCDFLRTDLWLDLRNKVVATLGLSGIGTAANAVPMQYVLNSNNQTIQTLEILSKYFAIGSYLISMFVGITVICRFFFWLKDRNNPSNKFKQKDNE